MSIAFACECGKKYLLDDELAGRRVRCQKCGQPVAVPMPATDADLGLATLAAVALASPEPVTVPPRARAPARLTYAVARQPPRRGRPVEGYFYSDGDGAIDRLVTWASLLALVAAVSIIGYRQLGSASEVGQLLKQAGRPDAASQVMAHTVGRLAGMAVGYPLVLAATYWLGVVVAAASLGFPARDGSFRRAWVGGCGAAGASLLAQTQRFDPTTGHPTAAAAAWQAVGLVALLAVPWLMQRLRPLAAVIAAVVAGLAMFGVVVVVAVVVGAADLTVRSIAAGPAGPMPMPMPMPQPPMASSAWTDVNPARPTTADPEALRSASQAQLSRIYTAAVTASQRSDYGAMSVPDLFAAGLPADALVPRTAGLRFTFRGFSKRTTPQTVVAYDEGGRWSLGGTDVLFGDGTVRFYPGFEADVVLVPPPPTIAVPRVTMPEFAPASPPPAYTYAPPPMPTYVPPPGPSFTPPPPSRPAAPPKDPVALLQRLATAYQDYAKAHAHRYPRSAKAAVDEAALTADEADAGTGRSLEVTTDLPPGTMPPTLIVAAVFDGSSGSYVVLYGDWHVAPVRMADMMSVRTRSDAVRARLRRLERR